MKVGDSLTGVAIDAGFGEYSERACATLGIEQAPAGLKAGMEVMLQVPGGKQRARVTEMTDTSFTLDANHPLAGKKLELDVELLSVDAGADAHETATFAGGCFWGVELAFQREPGVVGTKVGYCQGDAQEPSYEQVCTGATGHTEAVRVVFDPKVVTFGHVFGSANRSHSRLAASHASFGSYAQAPLAVPPACGRGGVHQNRESWVRYAYPSFGTRGRVTERRHGVLPGPLCPTRPNVECQRASSCREGASRGTPRAYA